MVLPNWVKVFGSQYIRTTFENNMDKAFSYEQNIEISRSYFEALDHPSEPCISDNNTANVSECIAKFIEGRMGCSIRVHGAKGPVRR